MVNGPHAGLRARLEGVDVDKFVASVTLLEVGAVFFFRPPASIFDTGILIPLNLPAG